MTIALSGSGARAATCRLLKPPHEIPNTLPDRCIRAVWRATDYGNVVRKLGGVARVVRQALRVVMAPDIDADRG